MMETLLLPHRPPFQRVQGPQRQGRGRLACYRSIKAAQQEVCALSGSALEPQRSESLQPYHA